MREQMLIRKKIQCSLVLLVVVLATGFFPVFFATFSENSREFSLNILHKVTNMDGVESARDMLIYGLKIGGFFLVISIIWIILFFAVYVFVIGIQAYILSQTLSKKRV